MAGIIALDLMINIGKASGLGVKKSEGWIVSV